MVDSIQGPGGASPLSTGSNETPELSGDFDDLIGKSDQLQNGDAMYFLKLQQQVAKESQMYEALSGLIKARKDAAEAPIRNM
jgi:hypothetical protein